MVPDGLPQAPGSGILPSTLTDEGRDPTLLDNARLMAHIPYVEYADAQGPLAELYQRYGTPDGVDNVVRIHSLNPPSMRHHMDLYAHLMRGRSPLSRAQREMIAVTVSSVNDCFY